MISNTILLYLLVMKTIYAEVSGRSFLANSIWNLLLVKSHFFTLAIFRYDLLDILMSKFISSSSFFIIFFLQRFAIYRKTIQKFKSRKLSHDQVNLALFMQVYVERFELW